MSPPRPPRLWPPLAVLVAIHLATLAAGFLAPYGEAVQDRARSLAPPSRLRWVAPDGATGPGSWHPRPFVYSQVEDPARLGEYREDRSRPYPLRFLVVRNGATRLFGVDEPGTVALLGTDRFGRDLFSRLLHGGRVSLWSGLLAGLLAVGLGLVLGGVAGFRGGAADAAIMRAAELFLALPWLYLMIGLRAFLPLRMSPAASFLMLVGVIGLLGWAEPARLVRGAVSSVRERDFVRAARGFGASETYLLWRHVLPQTWGLALTQLALLVPRYILAEVTLSFLGLGVAEPAASWGGLLDGLRESAVAGFRGPELAPAVALAVVILSYHQLAHALQRRLGTVQL